MRAIVFRRYGPPDVLELVDLPEPDVGPGEVRVRVRAAGVQSFNAKLRRGSFQGFVPVSFPQRLGNEFAGVLQREADLTRGHGILRRAGFIAVSGSTLEELDAGCAVVEQAAIQASLETRRCYGQQSQAFAVAALPLCRGI